jgi:hypothetical protein
MPSGLIPLVMVLLLAMPRQVGTKKSKVMVVPATNEASLKVFLVFLKVFLVHMSQMSKSINVMGGRQNTHASIGG